MLKIHLFDLNTIFKLPINSFYMDKEIHKKKVVEVCNTSIKYINSRITYLYRQNLLNECKAISEEFKEWIKDGRPKDNVLYLIKIE